MKKLIFLILLIEIIFEMVFDPTVKLGTGLTFRNLIFFSAFFLVIAYELITKNLKNKRLPGSFPLIVLFLICLLNILYFQFIERIDMPLTIQLKELKNWYFEPMIFYLLSLLIVDDEKTARSFLLILVITISVMNMVSLLGLILGLDVFPKREAFVDSDRFTGFGNPNKTAYLLCMMIPFMYYFQKYSSKIVTKNFFLVIIVLAVITIIFSGSRGGLVCLSFVFLGLSITLRTFRPIIIIIVCFLALVIFIGVNNTARLKTTILLERVSIVFSGDTQKATSNRSEIWKSILEYSSSDPKRLMMGSGFATTILIGEETRAHNLYLRVLMEFGIAGLILLFLLLIYGYRYFKKFSPGRSDSIKPFLQVSICSILLSFLFTDLGFFSFMALFLGFAISLMIYQEFNYKSDSDKIQNT